MVSIKKIFNHEVIQGASFMFVVQFFSYFVPLAILPLLSRSLSKDDFEGYLLALSLTGFIFLFSNLGINIVGVKDISNTIADKKLVVKKGVAYLLIQIFLSVLFVGLLGLASYFRFFSDKGSLVFSLYMILFVLFPVFWFQGIGQLKKAAIIMSLMKILLLALVVLAYFFGYVDIFSIALIYTFVQFLSVLIALYVLLKNAELAQLLDGILGVVFSLAKKCMPFYFSRIAIASYGNSIAFISSSVALAGTWSVLAIPDKVYNVIKNIMNPVMMAVFPFSLKAKDNQFYFFFSLSVFILSSAGCSILFYYIREIVSFTFGEKYILNLDVARMIVISVYFSILSQIFDYPLFSRFNLDFVVNWSCYFGASIFFCLLISFFFLSSINAINISISLLMTELFMFLFRLCAAFIYRKALFYSNFR